MLTLTLFDISSFILPSVGAGIVQLKEAAGVAASLDLRIWARAEYQVRSFTTPSYFITSSSAKSAP